MVMWIANTKRIQELIDNCLDEDKKDLNAGYYSFDELYAYKLLSQALLFNLLSQRCDEISIYKTKLNQHKEEYPGWFIVILAFSGKVISNHFPIEYWELFNINQTPFAHHKDDLSTPEVLDNLYLLLLEEIQSY